MDIVIDLLLMRKEIMGHMVFKEWEVDKKNVNTSIRTQIYIRSKMMCQTSMSVSYCNTTPYCIGVLQYNKGTLI